LFDDDDDDNGDDVFLAGRRVVVVVEAEEAAGRSTDRDTTGCGVVLKDEMDVANDANRIRRNIIAERRFLMPSWSLLLVINCEYRWVSPTD
jgi:hypothetical protein